MYMETNKPNHMKYIMYCRKSSESEDRQMLSLDAQERELKEMGKRKNIKVICVYRESQSAHHLGRPMFNEMNERINKGEANGIMVWHPNRIARNPLDGAMIIHMMDTGKIKEIKTMTKTYLNNGNDKFFLNFEFGMAKKNSDDLSDVVIRGMREKAERGEWPEKAKGGYINVMNPYTKKKNIEIDKNTFYLLQKAAKLVMSGKCTPMETLKILNNKWHYRTRLSSIMGGKPLSKAGFYNFLTDEYYYGKFKWHGIEYKGTHTPMLTEQEFDLIQLRLGRLGKPRITKHEFPYKEILKCGECRGSITAQEKYQIICPVCKRKFHKGKLTIKCPDCGISIEKMVNPKVLHYIYYNCTKKAHPECTQRNINITDIEKKIDYELSRFEIPEEFKNWAINHLNELNNKEEMNETDLKEQLNKRTNECDEEIRNLIKHRISPQNSDYDAERQKFYDEEENKLLKEKKDIKEQINKLDKRQEEWIKLTKDTFEFACYARYWFAKGDLKTKTNILSKLGKNLIIKDRQLFLDQEKPYFLIEKAKQEINKYMLSLEPEKRIIPAIQMLNLEPIKSIMLHYITLLGLILSITRKF